MAGRRRTGTGNPGPPRGLTRQRRGTVPQGRGRYPDFDVLAQAGHWDDATRRVVLGRVGDVPEIRFFDADTEAPALRAFCDTVMAQDSEPRIPVLEMVDRKLHEGKLDGFRFAGMPEDGETWRRVARELDATAAERGCAGGFAAACDQLRREIVQDFSTGDLDWRSIDCELAFSVVMRAVLSEFYSHPWAWNEIGFAGPAYPRGYARLGAGQREHWEPASALDIDPVQDVKRRGLE